MAQQHGTTLERALDNYASMEQKLRADLVGGLDMIVNNLGLKTPDGQPIGLRDIAYHVLSQTPEQLKLLQQGNQQSGGQQQIGALHQEIQGLKNQLQQMHTQQQFTYTRSQVDHFADSHPRFDELGHLIEQELNLGFDLETPTGGQSCSARPPTRLRPAPHRLRPDPRPIHFRRARRGPLKRRRRRRAPKNPSARREAIQNAIRRVEWRALTLNPF